MMRSRLPLERTTNQREQVLSALRQANLIVEPNWDVPPPISAEERAAIAQELSGNPPVSQLVLLERELITEGLVIENANLYP